MSGLQANWEQFKSILWLRWRLLSNQLTKSGKFNFAITMILIWSLFVVSALSLFVSFGLGVLLLRNIQPFYAMLTWDILIAVFLLMWFIGLMTELQRSEFLSLENMLQLPMSLKSAFALNYLTSLCTLGVIFFVPTAIGLSLAFAVMHGPALLLLLPLVAGLVWMVTAVTYQFRGWIARVMVNERRRRRVMVGMTLTFVALTQIPNIAIQYAAHRKDPADALQRKELAELKAEIAATSTDEADRQERLIVVENEYARRSKLRRDQRASERERYVSLANTWIPFGWPAVGCKQLMASQFSMTFVAVFGMLTLGSVSFWRAYVTTLRIYTRDDRAGGRKANAFRFSSQPSELHVGESLQDSQIPQASSWGPSQRVEPTRKVAGMGRRSNWLERTLPVVPEHVSSVAIASLVNLIRAPESKMALIGPLSMLGILGAIMFGKRRAPMPEGVEGFVLVASIGMILFFMSILSLNLFGMDRSGFRAFIMMPVRRQDILAGKNLALLPIFVIMAVPTMLLVNMLIPASLLCNLATLLQGASILVGITLIGNLMSIYFPMAVAAGTAKPVQMNFKVVGMQMLATFSFPLMMIPALIALGLELALHHFANISDLPIYFGVSVLQLIIAQFCYRRLIAQQGELLQARETKIMEALAINAE